jgi:hypothetical protein
MASRYGNGAHNGNGIMDAATTFDVSEPPLFISSTTNNKASYHMRANDTIALQSLDGNTIGHDNNILSMSPSFVSYWHRAMR